MALIKSYRGLAPKWGRDCYFSENATIVGDVTMGDECSVWFNAVVRGDVAPITIHISATMSPLDTMSPFMPAPFMTTP